MFRELQNVRQPDGEPRRRWFSDDAFELIVWYDDDDAVSGFQLCYQGEDGPRAATWHRGEGVSHARVDDGERGFRHHKAAPLLEPGGELRAETLERFRSSRGGLDPEIATLVVAELESHLEGPSRGAS